MKGTILRTVSSHAGGQMRCATLAEAFLANSPMSSSYSTESAPDPFDGANPSAMRPSVKDSQLCRGEGVAACHRARLEAGGEPALALLRAPVREGVGNDVSLRFTLESVVADRSRGP
jgi:hypothetical protein